VTDLVSWPSAERQALFQRWLTPLVQPQNLQPETLAPASADASFRRYLRLQSAHGSRVVMDAPPPLEDVRPFVRVAALLREAGLHAPEVLAADEASGFLLLADLGRELYLPALLQAQTAGDAPRAQALMQAALRALVQMQARVPAAALPAFSAALIQAELDLFPTWCVQAEHGITWGAAEQAAWQRICTLLIDNALQQPQVAVHADWMPRNLMVCPDGPAGGHGVGVLDFQDAVAAAITYDTASLLRDAFISWSEEQELDWAVRAWQLQRAAGLPVRSDFGQHWQELEWMGLQRHLKVLGIFCRLKHRDGKAAYAADLPRFFGYATRVALRYAPLKPLLRLLAPMSGNAVTSGATF
jgi:N-acetylmuramate 1-kinase